MESKLNPAKWLVNYSTRAAKMVEGKKKKKKIRGSLSELENIGPNVALQVKVSVFVTWLSLSHQWIDVQSPRITLLPKEREQAKTKEIICLR